MTDIAAAAERVSNFLANHEGRNGVDVEQLLTVHAVPELEPGTLLASDLAILVAAARTVSAIGEILDRHSR